MDTHFDAVNSVAVLKQCRKRVSGGNLLGCKRAEYTDYSFSNFIELGKREIIIAL